MKNSYRALLGFVAMCGLFLTGCVEGTQTVTPTSVPTQTQTETKTQQNSPDVSAGEPTKVADGIQWYNPKQIESLKLFGDAIGGLNSSEYDREQDAKYYLVGKFVTGTYKDSNLIIAVAPLIGMSADMDVYHFVQKGPDLTMLANHSEALAAGDGLIRSKFKIDDKYKIPSLIFPKSLVGANPRQNLEYVDYLDGLFDTSKLKKVYTDKTWGDVYTTAQTPVTYDDIFDRRGFYLRANDGTVRVYAAKFDIINDYNLPNVTWNDGTKNQDSYENTMQTGCGSVDFANVISSDVVSVEKDLVATGKTSKGDKVYEFKDSKNALLKEIYEKEYYAVDNTKIPYDQFVKGHPVFFWMDAFGRLIEFKNFKFVPAGECVKP